MLGLGLGVDKIRPVTAGGLLDLYPATAAYSLRALSSSTTNVIKVREDGLNQEQDFTADEITDGTLASFCGVNNGFVVTWYDQQGSNNATQSTAGSQPKIYDSSTGVVLENGKPALDFDGGDILSISDFNYNLNKQTILTVTNYTSNASFGYLFAHFDTLSDQRAFFLGKTDADEFRYGVSGTSTSVYFADSTETIAGQQKLISTIFDGSANFDIQSNGVGLTENYTGTPITSIFNSSADLSIGGFYVSGSPINIFNGTCQEIIFYDTDQSANRTQIESNINSHYNIYP